MFSATWVKDVFERSIATFAEAAIGLYILAGPADVFNLDTSEGALAAGVIAALAVVKGAIASKLGTNSASLNPDLQTVDTKTGQA